MRHPSRRALLLALALVTTPVLAGCLGGDGDEGAPAPTVNESDDTPEVGVNATGGLGAAETNRTVDGFGGKPHIHDYWGSDTEKVLLDRNVMWDPYPVFPEGGPSGGTVFQAYFQLDEGVLVYEGTGKLLLTAQAVQPADVPVRFQYRTAASGEWSAPVSVNAGDTIEIEVTPKTADSPHSYRSLWSFRYLSDAAARVLPPTSEIPTTLIAVKARSVEFWPGHPDFYADGPSRVILDTDASTRVGIWTDDILYDDRGTYVPAEFLVSMGTTRLEVFVNVTGFSGPPGSEPGEYYMVYRHPNLTWEENHDYHYNPFQEGDGGTGTFLHFTNLTVDHYQHDPPYAEFSRWMFRVNNYLKTAVDGCGNCAAYELSYRVTVVAWNDDWAPPEEDEETGEDAGRSA